MNKATQIRLDKDTAVDAKVFTQLVEKKAYALYVQRGFLFGHEWDDWFEAEKLIESEMSAVDKDCIRSENFFKDTHRPNPLPSGVTY